MSRNVDEDLIEATIQRVAEAEAARQTEPGSEPAPVALVGAEDPSAADGNAAPAWSSQLAHPVDPVDDEDPIEAAIRRVAAAKAEREAEAQADDAIEETVRRVAEARALRESEQPVDTHAAVTVEEGISPVESPAEVYAHESVIQEGGERTDNNDAPQPIREPVLLQQREDSGLRQVVAHLERELQQTRQEVAALSARVNALIEDLPRVSLPSAEKSVPAASSVASDDDWEETPRISRMSFGAPPRPAVFRDPSPAAATAELLVEVPEPDPLVDTRPLPSPLPPIRPDSRRGFDLLPRTYRVTVEDKRRGVDLVPLHRALLGMEGINEMSLLSYSNGVAIIALESTDQIVPDDLRSVIANAMARDAIVEVHNEQTMVVKLAED